MSKTFIVAELSANHGHNLDVALESVRAAKEAGADAVKIQTYTADTITLNCDADDFKVKGTLWDGRTLYDLYQVMGQASPTKASVPLPRSSLHGTRPHIPKGSRTTQWNSLQPGDVISELVPFLLS